MKIIEPIKEEIEITTSIGCPVACLKYCPQEVLTSRYMGNKLMALDDFRYVLKQIPKDVVIEFSGFCEPFVNPTTIQMIESAHSAGYEIAIYTTLFNVTKNIIERLGRLSFKEFVLHLPDGRVAKIPVTNEYAVNILSIMQKIDNIQFISMNNNFISNNRENIAREIFKTVNYRAHCWKHKYAQFVLLPNLDVQLCCMDFGLWHKIGNLALERYTDVRNRFLESKKDFRLCGMCSIGKMDDYQDE